MSKSTHTPSLENTTKEIRALLREAERLLARRGHETDHRLDALRERLRNVVDDSRERLDHMGEAAREQAQRCDEYVRSHPYHVVGIAAGIGALIGLLAARRTS